MWLNHTHAHTHTHTHTFISLMPERHGGRCLTVVHEYAEDISTVLSKDRSTLKSSSSSSLSPLSSFRSLSPQLASPKIYPSIFSFLFFLPPLSSPSSHSGWNGKSMHRSPLRVHTPFSLFSFFYLFIFFIPHHF